MKALARRWPGLPEVPVNASYTTPSTTEVMKLANSIMSSTSPGKSYHMLSLVSWECTYSRNHRANPTFPFLKYYLFAFFFINKIADLSAN